MLLRKSLPNILDFPSPSPKHTIRWCMVWRFLFFLPWKVSSLKLRMWDWIFRRRDSTQVAVPFECTHQVRCHIFWWILFRRRRAPKWSSPHFWLVVEQPKIVFLIYLSLFFFQIFCCFCLKEKNTSSDFSIAFTQSESIFQKSRVGFTKISGSPFVCPSSLYLKI